MAGMRVACGRVCDAAESDLFSAVKPHVTDTTFTVPKRPTELSRNYKLPGRGNAARSRAFRREWRIHVVG